MVLYFCKESQNYFNSFATLVPIGALRWYRFLRYVGTDSCAMMVPFRRYYQCLNTCRSIFSLSVSKAKPKHSVRVKLSLPGTDSPISLSNVWQ